MRVRGGLEVQADILLELWPRFSGVVLVWVGGGQGQIAQAVRVRGGVNVVDEVEGDAEFGSDLATQREVLAIPGGTGGLVGCPGQAFRVQAGGRELDKGLSVPAFRVEVMGEDVVSRPL